METVKHRISAGQFFLMMFVSRVVVTIALSARYLGGENMLEAIFSYGLAMALGLLLALPVRGLARLYPELSIGDAAQAAWGKSGKAVPFFYLLYFILVNGSSLGLFQIFLLDTVNPEFSAALTIAALLGVALYGAFRGIETVARCAVCVFAVLLVGAGLVFVIVAFRFDPENLEPLFYHGFSQTLQGTELFLARTSVFADMAVLLPMVNGKRKAGFFGWAGGTFLFTGILLLLLAGCLGPYAATQNFPVYSLSSITEIRSMQRLDAVFVGVWMTGMIVKLACDLYACRVCFASLAGKKCPKTALLLSGAAILILAYAAAGSIAAQRVLLNTRLLLFCTVGVGSVLPFLVWGIGWLKRRKER